jgi:hypothetical protein
MTIGYRSRQAVVVAAVIAALTACSSGGSATNSATTTPSAATGTSTTKWLCRPGLADDPCTTSTAATVISATGATSNQPAAAPGTPPIDCFYVYPTVSSQTTVNANLNIDPEIRAIAVAQASRFAPDCRIFAPVYRQLTLAGAVGRGDPQHPAGSGQAPAALAYSDVKAAWEDYLAHDNNGRGFVLIGHSQGSGRLIQLIKDDIDNNPAVRNHLVSAVLLGGNVQVPVGKDVGGSFQNVPACRSNDQNGCVVAYSSFLNTPPQDTLFGRVPNNPALQVLCTNPANLAGGSGALQPYFNTTPFPGPIGAVSAKPPTAPTPWVTEPGLYTAQCQNLAGADVLHVTPVVIPGDTRTLLTETAGPTLGLHLYDVNIAYGNLVDLVKTQSDAYQHHA